jgi:hypothetical protein
MEYRGLLYSRKQEGWKPERAMIRDLLASFSGARRSQPAVAAPLVNSGTPAMDVAILQKSVDRRVFPD